MANYCRQCSEEYLGEDFGDFASSFKGIREVTCDGCGFTEVNQDGECLNPNCTKWHTYESINADKVK